MFLVSRLRAALVLLILCGASALAQTPEYRASWADAFHTGYLSQSAVTNTVNNLRSGNLNVFVPEIYVNSGSQLIYWNPTATEYPDLGATGTIVSNGVQIKCDLNSDPETNSAGSFDPLAESIRQCHDTSGGKARLDVWAWMVSFRSSGPLPAAHPEWITVNAGGASQSDFDPGHPGSEQQLVNNCLDIVKHYDVDGLNFDYIRFTDSNNGFNAVSVARYNAIYGKSGTPTTSDAAFKQWRRDQVTNVIRKIYLNVIAVKPNVKMSVDAITWTPSPTRPTAADPNPLQTWKNSFQANSGAYTGVYQDWRGWMEEGIVDISMPMNYFRECANQVDSDKWADFTKDNQFGRQCVIGPGGYLNILSDALAQFARTRDASSTMHKYGAGQNNYSYAIPYAASCGGTEIADPVGWFNALKAGMYSQVVPVPALPRLTNGKGHIKGTVTNSQVPKPGWLDAASVSLSANSNGSSPIRTMKTDGTGFYGFVDVPPGTYYLVVSFKGLSSQIKEVAVTPANVTTMDFDLGVTASQIAVLTQPSAAKAGQPLPVQPAILVKDDSGNTVVGFNGPVSVAIKAGTGYPGATLGGTTTVNAVGGVATFTNLSIDKVGFAYRLTASSGSLAPVDTAAFDINTTAVRLAFEAQPGGAKAGKAFGSQPAVVAQNDSGGVAADYVGNADLSIKDGTGAAAAYLDGTTSLAFVNGRAAFTDLAIADIGAGYVLTASSGILPAIDSTPFDVVDGGPFTLADAIRAASILGGLSAASSMDMARLDVEQPAGVDLFDATRILRKAAGLEPNP